MKVVGILLILSVTFLSNAANISKLPMRMTRQQSVRSKDARIAGGTEATDGQFPWQVALSITFNGENKKFCGGALISERHVVTTASCLYEMKSLGGSSQLKIRIGSLYANGTGGTELLTNKGSVYLHEKYNVSVSPVANDIALILLRDGMQSDKGKPIEMDSIGDNCAARFVGQKVTASGWGKISDSILSGISPTLYFTEMTVSDTLPCSGFYGADHVTEDIICAPTSPDKKSTCRGDVGGPLTDNNNPPKLIGLTSIVPDECEQGHPVAFTCIGYHRQWINDTMVLHP